MKRAKKIAGVSLAIVVLVVTILAAVDGFIFNEDNANMEITSRTEYIGGDEGQVLADVRFALSGLPAPATCWASALYPDKTPLFTNELMSATSLGTYNYSFEVPNVEGVFEYQAVCQVTPSKNITRSKAFHVSALYRLLTEDIRSQVSFLEQGVDEVQLNTNARNGWKIESPFVTNISDVSCRIQPLDEEAVILFSDDFERVAEDPPTDPWYATEADPSGFPGWPNMYVSGGKLTSEVYRGVLASSGYAVADANISFAPVKFYGEMDITWASSSVPYSNNWFGLYFFNSSDDLIGKYYMRQQFTGYNWAGNGDPMPQYDDAGLYSGCVASVPNVYCNTVLIPKSTDPAPIFWEENIKENMATTTMDWDEVAYTMVRAGGATTSEGRNFVDFDNIILLAEPTGTEFIDNPNQNFGINWSASRDNAVTSWHDYRVMCAVIYDVDLDNGTRIAEAIEQYVYVSNHNRLRAVIVK